MIRKTATLTIPTAAYLLASALCILLELTTKPYTAGYLTALLPGIGLLASLFTGKSPYKVKWALPVLYSAINMAVILFLFQRQYLPLNFFENMRFVINLIILEVSSLFPSLMMGIALSHIREHVPQDAKFRRLRKSAVLLVPLACILLLFIQYPLWKVSTPIVFWLIIYAPLFPGIGMGICLLAGESRRKIKWALPILFGAFNVAIQFLLYRDDPNKLLDIRYTAPLLYFHFFAIAIPALLGLIILRPAPKSGFQSDLQGDPQSAP